MFLMREWILEKAPILEDGSIGEWEVSTYGNKPETWADESSAADAAAKRNQDNYLNCVWRHIHDW